MAPRRAEVYCLVNLTVCVDMPSCIIEAFDRNATARADSPALYRPNAGHWTPVTWREYRDQVRRTAKALIALGVAPGEHTTILGFNCPEWFFADLGSIAAGA